MKKMSQLYTKLYGGKMGECTSKPHVHRWTEAVSRLMQNHGDARLPSEPRSSRRQRELLLPYPLHQSRHYAQIPWCRNISGANHLADLKWTVFISGYSQWGVSLDRMICPIRVERSVALLNSVFRRVMYLVMWTPSLSSTASTLNPIKISLIPRP